MLYLLDQVIFTGTHRLHWVMLSLLGYVNFTGTSRLLGHATFTGPCRLYWDMSFYWDMQSLLEQVIFSGKCMSDGLISRVSSLKGSLLGPQLFQRALVI